MKLIRHLFFLAICTLIPSIQATQTSTKNSAPSTPAQQAAPATALSSVLGGAQTPPQQSIAKLTGIIMNQSSNTLEALIAENFSGVRPDAVVAWQTLLRQLSPEAKMAFIQGCKQQLTAQETKKWTIGLGLTGVIGIFVAVSALPFQGGDLRGDIAAMRIQLTQNEIPAQYWGAPQPTIAGRLRAMADQGLVATARLQVIHENANLMATRLAEVAENTHR